MRKLQPFLLLAFFGAIFSATAQQKQVAPAFDCNRFFLEETPLTFTIISDFKKLKAQKQKGVYMPAFATLRLSATDSLADSIRIYARGEFRREQCQMPSLMVNFKSKKASPFSELKKLKMVCGCSSSEYNERLVLMEYLTYKIYNLLTDMSFRVRLAQMTYKDKNNKTKPYTQYAFFIEDVDDMAKRNNCREYEKSAAAVYTNRNQTLVMSVFQYMIGNLDWSIPNYHNVKLIQSLEDTTSFPFIVPYDFDFAGIVNAPYAFPNHESFAVERVTDRFYRGLPRTAEEVEAVMQIYQAAKPKMIQLINSFELLPEGDRKTMMKYVEEFYKTISNPKLVEHHFVKGKSK